LSTERDVALNYELAIEHVRRFKAHCEASLAIQEVNIGGYTHLGAWRSADEGIRAELPFVEAAAQEVAPHLVPMLRQPDAVISHHYKDEAAHELLVLLESRDEMARMLEGSVPSLKASALHEWVWGAARRSWESGDFADSVRSAAHDVFINHLVGILAADETATPEVLCEALLPDAPTPKSARLRVSDFPQDSTEYTAAQTRAHRLGVFCATLVRGSSLLTSPESWEVQAFEALAALSMFARLIDGARLERFG
jgi:hypothetical protein